PPTEMLLGATGVEAFTGTASNGVGVGLTDGTVALAFFDDAGTITYAFDVKGTAAVVGLPANSISIVPGNIEFRDDTAGVLSTEVTFGTATGTSTIAGDAVSNVTVADGGFGYQTPPTVTFSGGGGTGATGTAILTDGVVTGVTITDGGSGY